jgi:hypothetical protein
VVTKVHFRFFSITGKAKLEGGGDGDDDDDDNDEKDEVAVAWVCVNLLNERGLLLQVSSVLCCLFSPFCFVLDLAHAHSHTLSTPFFLQGTHTIPLWSTPAVEHGKHKKRVVSGVDFLYRTTTRPNLSTQNATPKSLPKPATLLVRFDR